MHLLSILLEQMCNEKKSFERTKQKIDKSWRHTKPKAIYSLLLCHCCCFSLFLRVQREKEKYNKSIEMKMNHTNKIETCKIWQDIVAIAMGRVSKRLWLIFFYFDWNERRSKKKKQINWNTFPSFFGFLIVS